MSDATPRRNLSDFDRLCIEAYQTMMSMDRPSVLGVSKLLNLPRGTVKNRIKKYHLRNLGQHLPLDVLPGHEIKQHTQSFDGEGKLTGQTVQTRIATSDEPFSLPDGHRVKGESALLNSDGSIIQKWVKTEVIRGTDAEAVLESFRIAAEQLAIRSPIEEAVEAVTAPALRNPRAQDVLNLHPLADLHLGLYVWGKHCGVSWDLATAIKTIKQVMEELILDSKPAEIGIILGGGDLLHADDETKKTRRSGHVLDVDSRYEKVLAEAEMLMVYQVELALTKYPKVVVRILPGNHDDDSAVAVSHFLRAWFRNEPRVTVDTAPGPFFVFEWGKTLLGGVHGHETKIENLKDVLTADFHEEWGRTKFRYCHGFHWHTGKLGDERGGARWETHQTPIPRDAYAHDHGFRSGRSMQVISYSKHRGECGRSVSVL